MSRLAPAQRLMRSSMPFSKLKAATCSKVVTPISYSRNISTTGPALSSSSTSLEKWIQAVQSQTKTLHDTADLNKARQLLLVLPNLSSSLVTSSRNLLEKHTGEDAMSLSPGSPMPFGAELVLFNPLLSECTLGSDGTERTFGPPGGLDQRMWASGSFEFEKGKRLKMGQDVTCKVAVESVQPKEGAKTGKMVLVTRKLRYENDEGLVMTERRCHVYRKQKPAEERRYRAPVASNAPKASEVEEKHSDFGFDYYATRAALFRYSAATFNAHRIHLDPEYCRNEEGHSDCLVHGPLTATLLLSLIASASKEISGQVHKFEYRATSPLTVEQTIRLRGAWEGTDKKAASLFVLNEAGTVCMTAKVTVV